MTTIFLIYILQCLYLFPPVLLQDGQILQDNAPLFNNMENFMELNTSSTTSTLWLIYISTVIIMKPYLLSLEFLYLKTKLEQSSDSSEGADMLLLMSVSFTCYKKESSHRNF